MKKIYIIIGVFIVLILGLFISLNIILSNNNKENEDSINSSLVSFYDIGKSNITIIQKDNFNILIGTGSFDDQERLLKVISSLNISKFEYVILPNLEESSIGNIGFLINNYDISYLYMKTDTLDNEEFNEALTNHYLEIIPLTSTEVIEIGTLTINIYMDKDNNYYFDINENNHSINIINNVSSIDKISNSDVLVFDDYSLARDTSFAYYIYDGNDDLNIDATELKRDVSISLNDGKLRVNKMDK